ncbi:S16 family serine protease [Shewanella youngdeokensis]|uniref:endopeptidase La n=1 Tax=Shewanella youngdeokensis TaxID=2999068 RepID=A0ABZ0JW36_9GAMM|nr:S16 family serine protease [Shewanella sp. DAU334]
MNSNIIPTSALKPQFTFTASPANDFSADAPLIGQARVRAAFKLLTHTRDQHMYLADFNGCDRKGILNALVKTEGVIANKQLVLKDDSTYWTAGDTDADSVLASKQHDYVYLSGTIKKHDLIGRYNTSSNQYQPGALASSHYLFVCADSIWKREALWELLLEIIDKKEYQIHSSLPALALDCKIILIGSINQYGQCWLGEPSFSNHFPLLGESVNEIDLTETSVDDYNLWLNFIIKRLDLTLDTGARQIVLEYSARLADHQQRLSLMAVNIEQLLAQAAALAQQQHIDASALTHCLDMFSQRHNASEKLSAQNFDDLFIALPTEDEQIGQINGLTVIENAEYSYGEPARITASVHYGDGEVADIERKSELAGNIHAKGMMILSSCLYRIFGKDAPLHLNANIVFEQSYQEIDGDSASLAEYCSLISAISEKPIKQSIAATGAIDQFGNVQAIGGVNEKIEGFFKLCQRRGLTGQQGVIIPCSNMQQLNLHRSVIEAIEKGLFTLYQVKHIDEAAEILMQTPAGIADEDNQFPEGSLYGLVQERLDALAGYQDEEKSFFVKLREKLSFFS